MVIETAAEAGKATIIDPKRRDFSIYRDATLIKPNRRELADATGLPCETDQQAETAALAAIAQTNSAILLTRSEHGMSYFERDAKPLHLKTAALGVFDVSGAGDTVLALAGGRVRRRHTGGDDSGAPAGPAREGDDERS
jgi:D-beta-D-heptose 7-phosphate kinase/D-beta-D-heptose 1-phosphate adenosyltransferase